MAVMVYNLKNFYISPHNISHTLLPWPENLLTDKEVLASLLGNFLWSFKYNNNHWPPQQHHSVLLPGFRATYLLVKRTSPLPRPTLRECPENLVLF